MLWGWWHHKVNNFKLNYVFEKAQLWFEKQDTSTVVNKDLMVHMLSNSIYIWFDLIKKFNRFGHLYFCFTFVFPVAQRHHDYLVYLTTVMSFQKSRQNLDFWKSVQCASMDHILRGLGLVR